MEICAGHSMENELLGGKEVEEMLFDDDEQQF